MNKSSYFTNYSSKKKDSENIDSNNEKSGETSKQMQESIRCTVRVNRMDYLGKIYGSNTNEQELESKSVNLSYLKLINVPTMFDIGCTQANP
jgi:hypothetical protein